MRRGAFPFSEEAQEAVEAVGDRYEQALLELALERNPDDIEILARLGELYPRLGHAERGLAMDRRLVVLAPRDPLVRYNLACSLSLVGEAEEACKALGKAIQLGYDDLDHMLSDPDLRCARAHPMFQDVLRLFERRRR